MVLREHALARLTIYGAKDVLLPYEPLVFGLQLDMLADAGVYWPGDNPLSLHARSGDRVRYQISSFYERGPLLDVEVRRYDRGEALYQHVYIGGSADSGKQAGCPAGPLFNTPGEYRIWVRAVLHLPNRQRAWIESDPLTFRVVEPAGDDAEVAKQLAEIPAWPQMIHAMRSGGEIAAARAIVWDEPLAAEAPLREALGDPDPRVAREAAYTLRYYPSRRTWRALEVARSHPDPDVVAQASESAEDIRDYFRSWTTGKERAWAHVRRWLEPIWSALAFEERNLVAVRTLSPDREVHEEAPSVAWLLERLDDPCKLGELRASLYRVDWARYDPGEHAILTTRLAKHADPCVRRVATWAFHAWGDQGALFDLVRDPYPAVRKSALYWLGQTPPHSVRVGGLALERLADPGVYGSAAREALEVYVRCVEPSESMPRLVAWARDDAVSEILRVESVFELTRVGAIEEVRSLLPILLEPPPLTWALAIALLEGAERFGLEPPGLESFLAEDNVDLQGALAPFV